jgi:ABC-type multidrug transport system permease subunit
VSLTDHLHQIPYLLLSSVVFVIPYFYIVGFDNNGDATDKFFWYWLFQALYVTAMVFMGHLLASGLPNESSCAGKPFLIKSLLVLFLILFCHVLQSWVAC